MLGIPFQLDRPAFASLYVQPAARRAFGAGAGVVGGNARNLVLGLNQVGNQLLYPLSRTAGNRHRPSARRPEDGEEAAAIHSFFGYFVGHSDSVETSSCWLLALC